MKHLQRAALFVVCALAVSACSSPQPINRTMAGSQPLNQANSQSDRQVHIDLIKRMLSQDQNYAALAHIEQVQRQYGSGDNELRLLEADTRRRLGQTGSAQQLYNALVNTPFAAQAYHGLGLIAAATDPAQSLDYLRRAVRMAPTDVQLRNDLGYALMLARRYPEALPELATAVELDASSDKSRNNLIILMMLMRDETAVQRIVRESQVDAATVANLRKRAQAMAAAPAPRRS